MKKILLLVTMLTLTFCGCEIIERDETHATLELTTSYGEKYSYESFNLSGSALSLDKASEQNKIQITLKKGQYVDGFFQCEQCHEQQFYRFDEPYCGVICCKCPANGDQDGNVTEYISINVTVDDSIN